jgi:hypothetical protein
LCFLAQYCFSERIDKNQRMVEHLMLRASECDTRGCATRTIFEQLVLIGRFSTVLLVFEPGVELPAD